jgi:hypothetical protein
MRTIIALTCALALILIAVSSRVTADSRSQPADELAGAQCIVRLRGDAMGVIYNDRIPSLGNLQELDGTMSKVTADSYVLTHDGHTYWIPKTSVALVEVKK